MIRRAETPSAGVGEHPQVGQHVLDLAPLVEPHRTDHLVSHAEAGKALLHGPALGVDPVEHRHSRQVEPLSRQLADLLSHEPALVGLVLGGEQRDRSTLAEVAPETLGPAAPVVGDHRVGGLQDGLGGAVVLVEHHHPSLRVVPLEVEDVADVGAAEPVDRLIGVPNRADVGSLPAELPDQHVLGAVGVLELVDMEVPEALPVVVQHFRAGIE